MQEDNKTNGATTADIMEFLKEHMVMREDAVMKEDFEEFKNTVATKEDLKKLEVRFDSLEVRFDSLDARLVEMQSELESIRLRLDDIEKRLKEDTDALVFEVQGLKKRVILLEQQLGIARASAGV